MAARRTAFHDAVFHSRGPPRGGTGATDDDELGQLRGYDDGGDEDGGDDDDGDNEGGNDE